MLRSMRAVVTPQEVINGCLSAAQATGLGRNTLLGQPLSLIDYFGFCVQPDDYPTVSTELHDMLDRICVSQLSIGGEVTMGLQKQSENLLSWFHESPLPGLAVVSSQGLLLHAGGGYVALHADLMTAYHWLQQHDVEFHFTNPYGAKVIWVPLHTPDYGVGDGYYALCVVGESLFQTTSRLTAYPPCLLRPSRQEVFTCMKIRPGADFQTDATRAESCTGALRLCSLEEMIPEYLEGKQHHHQ